MFLYGLSASGVLALSMIGWGVLTAFPFVGALALFYVAKPKKVRDLLWLGMFFPGHYMSKFLLKAELGN